MSAACPVCAGPARPETGFGPAPLLRCERCAFVFLAAPDTRGLYADDYFSGYAGGDYTAHAAERQAESAVRLDWLAAWAPPPATLLEVGAAAGFFLAAAVGRGYAGWGVEPNASMAAAARERGGVDVRTGTLGDHADGAGPVDAVCAWHVVEHLPDPVRDLTLAAGLLRPGGHVFVEVPNIASVAARRRGAAWPALDLPYHVGHHGPRSMRALLERAGLEVLAVDTLPFAAYDVRVRRAGRPAAAARMAVESVRARALLRPGPHPIDHELLRAVARRP